MFTFKNGVHPNSCKELSKDRPIRIVNTGKTLVFPMSQHLGAPAKPIVKVGDDVLVGQIIGEADGFISANVLSSVSGKVKAIEERLVISGQKSTCVVVENDEKYETINGFGMERDYTSLSNEEIIKIIKDAGIVGLGGACFPTHVKLSPKEPDKIEYILVNGAECEPYLTSDYRLMIEEPEMIIKGLQVILKLFPNAKGVICVEDNKKDAYEKLTISCSDIGNIETALLKTKYPQGGERQLIYAITNRKLNSNMLPADVGCIVDNVDTVISIANAVCKSTPLIRRILTLSGKAFKDYGNFNVRLGISYNELIDTVGGFKTEPIKLISGGPMMGLPIYNLDMPVAKNSSAVLAFDNDPLKGIKETNCLNCGRCVSACPIGLIPTKLYKAAKTDDFEKFNSLDGMDCISCGCCSYICPANKPLTPYFVYMKDATRNYLKNKKETK